MVLCVRREVVKIEVEEEGQSSLLEAWNGKSIMVFLTHMPAILPGRHHRILVFLLWFQLMPLLEV